MGDPAKDDTTTTVNIACNKAKAKMAAAWEDISEKDAAYTFDKDGKPIAAQWSLMALAKLKILILTTIEWNLSTLCLALLLITALPSSC